MTTMQKELLIGGENICYEIVRKKVKNINITVRPDGSVRVSAPRNVPEEFIQDILRQKGDFLLKNIKKYEAAKLPEEIFYLGRPFSVIYGEDNCIRGQYAVLKDKANFNECLDLLYKQAAEEIFPEIYEQAYKRFSGIHKPGLRLRSMKTRWGSYSSVSDLITLNTRLAAAPPICIEAVAAHELAHVLVMDHSRRFYQVLLSAMPEYKSCHKLLKQFSFPVYRQG